MGKIAVEGRKFGLALAIASQSLGGLGERLRAWHPNGNHDN
jgi:DNA helicase HerA-like ATPase